MNREPHFTSYFQWQKPHDFKLGLNGIGDLPERHTNRKIDKILLKVVSCAVPIAVCTVAQKAGKRIKVYLHQIKFPLHEVRSLGVK